LVEVVEGVVVVVAAVAAVVVEEVQTPCRAVHITTSNTLIPITL
jgi:hypothetical protein